MNKETNRKRLRIRILTNKQLMKRELHSMEHDENNLGKESKAKRKNKRIKEMKGIERRKESLGVRRPIEKGRKKEIKGKDQLSVKRS